MSSVRTIIDIALLRRGPQHLPASVPLALAAVCAYVAAGVLAQVATPLSGDPFGPVVLDAALLILLALTALQFRGLAHRSLETIAALAGSGTVLTLVGLPVLRLVVGSENAGPAAALGVILWLTLVAWSLVVTAHILRHALAVGHAAAMAISVGFLVTAVLAYGALFDTSA